MKKLYTLIIALVSLVSFNANAVTINVSVGSPANMFSPSNFTANIGDVVVWTWVSGTHNVTSNSASVPPGATPFVSPTQSSGTFSYTITTAGTYGYVCTIHAGSGMVGQFTVNAVGIAEPAVDLLTQVYPNPFRDKITVKYNGIEKIDFFNIVGEKVKTVSIDQMEGKLDVDFNEMPSGVYFFRSYKDGNIVETRKIVKAK